MIKKVRNGLQVYVVKDGFQDCDYFNVGVTQVVRRWTRVTRALNIEVTVLGSELDQHSFRG